MAGGKRERSTAPGAASAARAGVWLSFAGRSAVFRRRRYGPALLREAPRCSCPAVACGDRGVSDSTWAAGLLFGADGVAVTVSVDRVRPGMPPRPPRLPHSATTVSASMQDAFCCPLVPRERSRSLARPPPAVSMSTTPAIGRMAHRVRFAPAARRSSGMAHPCPRGCISRPQVHHTRVSCKPRFGTWASPSTSYVWRARTGFPPAVWSPSLSGWLPTTPPQGGSNMGATIASAPKRHQNYLLITLAAAALRADLAPRHYRIPPPGDIPRKATSAASCRRPAVTGRCASHSDRGPPVRDRVRVHPQRPSARPRRRVGGSPGALRSGAGGSASLAGVVARTRRRERGVWPEAGRRVDVQRRTSPPFPTTGMRTAS